MEKIIKQYTKLLKKMQKEKQFSKQIELNKEMRNLKIQNNLEVKKTDCGFDILQNSALIAKLQNKYSKRKINLEYKVVGLDLKMICE